MEGFWLRWKKFKFLSYLLLESNVKYISNAASFGNKMP